jgi:hypothetical protein
MSDPTKHGLGAKPHNKDDRNWLYREHKTAILEAVGMAPTSERSNRWHEMHGSGFRMNQGSEGTCVGHAITNNFLATPRPHEAFPDFGTVDKAHQFARAAYLAFTGDETYQQGAYMVNATAWAMREGYISNYYRCTDVPWTVDAILDIGPVFWASPWFNSMYYEDSQLREETGEYYIKVNPNSELRGYHAYLLTGVDLQPEVGPPFVRMQNSWGSDWGKNGTARITLDDLAILYDGDSFILTEKRF